jgi:hypothetical protein
LYFERRMVWRCFETFDLRVSNWESYEMKFGTRSFLALAIPILVLPIIAAMLFNWRYNYVDFSGLTALGIVLLALAVLFVLAPRDRGPRLVILQLIALPRKMFDSYYGARPLQPGEAPGAESTKAHRKFVFTAGGHVARFAGGLMRLVSQGAGGQPQLLLARSGTA